MLYHPLYPLHTKFSVVYIFRYITFRTIYATITALVISFIFGPWLINKLSSLQIGQSIRKVGPESHFKKEGTPTMGGTLILVASVIPARLVADLTNIYGWVTLLVTVGYGAGGFVDEPAAAGAEREVEGVHRPEELVEARAVKHRVQLRRGLATGAGPSHREGGDDAGRRDTQVPAWLAQLA